ncbi:MurR/RpiR family transcriptional regulator [Amorphus sp. MBR-141]
MIIERIRNHYNELPGSERPLADLLLEFPGDIVLYSAGELSARAGVSNAAASRLFKRLGYQDYREAREAVRAAQASGQPIYLNNSLPSQPASDDSLGRQLSRDIDNLRATFDEIDRTALADAIEGIGKAANVWCIGYRNSYFFASYARRQLAQTRAGVHLLPQPGQVLMEEIAGIGTGDVALVVGLRRRAEITATAMQFLAASGVPILYVTDHRADRTARLATWVLRCRTRGVSLFDSYVGVISLLNHVCTEVAAGAGDAARQRFAAIETANDAGGELEVELRKLEEDDI